MNPLLLLAIKEMPNIIDFVKSAFVKANPGAPMPTSEEVLQMTAQAITSSLAKDENWLKAHPQR